MSNDVKSKFRYRYQDFFHRDMGFKILSDPLQDEYVRAILAPTSDVQAVFSDSPSGTGKSSLALASAYYLLAVTQEVKSIVYVRNTVSVRENGFLPGTVEDKEAAYMKPAEDNINRIGKKTGQSDLFSRLIESKQLICTSTSFMRGIDYEDDMILIIDEAQNLDLIELQTVLTRPHDNVKIVVIGSSLQVDNPKIKRYGENREYLPFQLYQKHFMDQERVPVESINLVRNYRGRFAQLADNIHTTLDKFN